MGLDPISWIAIAGLAVSAAGTVSSMESQRKAANAQKDQAAFQKRIADVKNMRAQRDAIRQARIARAQVVNAGANSGTSTSSGVEGGASSVGSQLGGNLSYFGEVGGLQDNIFNSQQEQASYISDAAVSGALGSLGGTVFQAAGGYTTIFGGNKKDTGGYTTASMPKQPVPSYEGGEV